MITTALSKIETSEAAQHTADNDEIGTYGEFYYSTMSTIRINGSDKMINETETW